MIMLIPGGSALAWLSPGHMATGAIAYDALDRRDPDAVAAIVSLERNHPDYPRFERFLGDAKGASRERKLFELMARWPDDARGGPYDHPDWHFSEKIESSARYLLPFAWGRARTAYLKALGTARDGRASAADRAVALCWVMHIAGDMHEPEHAGLWMSRRFLFTDQAGNIAWVRTTPAMRPEKLHWLWDSAGAVDPDEGRRRDPDAFAARLEASHPDPGALPLGDPPQAFDSWVDESREISRSVVYKNGTIALGVSPGTAALFPAGYVEQVQTISEARLALAGYRIAETLQGLR